MFSLGPVWLLRLSGGNFLLVTGASRQISLARVPDALGSLVVRTRR